MRSRFGLVVVLFVLAFPVPGRAAIPAPALSGGQALAIVGRDDSGVRRCIREDPKAMRAGVSVRPIAAQPRLELIEIQASCICGAQNCPFWVYRLDGGPPRQLLTDFAIDVRTARSAT